MDHIAIMNKSWKLIPKIINGQKTIESRWYKSRFSPWNKVSKGDTVYFKNSSESITAKAKVSKVLQFDNLNLTTVRKIINNSGQQICLQNTNYRKWTPTKKYCILIFLEKPQAINKPFAIDKRGFGIGTAWITINHIETIKINS